MFEIVWQQLQQQFSSEVFHLTTHVANFEEIEEYNAAKMMMTYRFFCIPHGRWVGKAAQSVGRKIYCMIIQDVSNWLKGKTETRNFHIWDMFPSTSPFLYQI
jgi:hypothetical protein